MTEIGGFGLSAPATQGDADRAASLRAEPEPPGCGHVERSDFADDRAEPAVMQAFLDRGEHGLVIARLDIDYAVGLKAPARALGRKGRDA